VIQGEETGESGWLAIELGSDADGISCVIEAEVIKVVKGTEG
jgi:hypothetical protein